MLLNPFLSFAQDTRDSDSPYGVLDFLHWDHPWNGHHYNKEKMEEAVQLMKRAGVGFVRMDFLWEDIEPRKNHLDYSKYDGIVDLLAQNDIKILGVLGYNVSWNSRAWNAAPDIPLFVKYARRVVRRYKDRVKYWEIWNEPDVDIYWVPQDDMKTYGALLRAVYPALKSEDPTCLVVMGANSRYVPLGLRRLYMRAGKENFDIVNLHPFVDPLSPGAMELLRSAYRGTYKVMQSKADGDKPIWITEIGCPGVDEVADNWWLGKNPSEAEQAQWVKKVYGEPLKWKGVKKIFWAFFRDTPNHFGNGTDYFGLVRRDFSLKPAYMAYQAVATKQVKVKPAKVIDVDLDG